MTSGSLRRNGPFWVPPNHGIPSPSTIGTWLMTISSSSPAPSTSRAATAPATETTLSPPQPLPLPAGAPDVRLDRDRHAFLGLRPPRRGVVRKHDERRLRRGLGVPAVRVVVQAAAHDERADRVERVAEELRALRAEL